MNKYQRNIESLVYKSTPIDTIKQVREEVNYLEVIGWTAQGANKIYRIYDNKTEEVVG